MLVNKQRERRKRKYPGIIDCMYIYIKKKHFLKIIRFIHLFFIAKQIESKIFLLVFKNKISPKKKIRTKKIELELKDMRIIFHKHRFLCRLFPVDQVQQQI